MLSHSSWAALVAILLTTANLHGQSYLLKIKQHADPGKSVVCKEADTRSGSYLITAPDGTVLENPRTTGTREEVFTEIVLERGEKAPRKYRRIYEKATVTEGDRTMARSYLGKSLLFEQQADRVSVRVEGNGELLAVDAEELSRLALQRSQELDEVVLPKQPVKVGEKWTVDPRALAAGYSRTGELDIERTSGEGVLAKVYDREGVRFGVIEVKLKLAIKDSQGLRFSPPGTLEATFILDAALDGSTTSATFQMSGKMSGKGAGERVAKDGTRTKYFVELSTLQAARQERSAEK